MSYTNGLDKPSDYFTTKLFTGNGGTNAITGVGFQPDWIWFKNRTSAQSHAIVDSVRERKGLQSNTTEAEYTLASGKDFGTFDSDGFTVLTPQQLNSFNYNTGSIVSWNWVAGTSFTNDASGTGIGSIDSAGSASDASGFSICSYTGTGSNATVKHGLSTTPSMIIHKRRDDASGWPTWHTFLGTGILELNENGASQGGSSYTNGTQNFHPTKVMLLLMVHLFIQDLNQLLLWLKNLQEQVHGQCRTIKELLLMFKKISFCQFIRRRN